MRVQRPTRCICARRLVSVPVDVRTCAQNERDVMTGLRSCLTAEIVDINDAVVRAPGVLEAAAEDAGGRLGLACHCHCEANSC